jgi:S-adenosylmethionine:tRNA ribosyltransferase-isomerase
MHIHDFDFELPAHLIAQHPAAERTASRLLQVTQHALVNLQFNQIVELITPNDLLVFNDTRVINARLFGVKDSGGKVEVLIERVLDVHRARAMIRASHAPKVGSHLKLAHVIDVVVEHYEDGMATLTFDRAVLPLLEQYGQLPLPPYIDKTPNAADAERYQTVYAKHEGSVAAPTAGLHFDQTLLNTLTERGIRMASVTLHIGAGTFIPVRVERIEDHQMHREWYDFPAATAQAINETRACGGRVIAVGTTSLRTLESVALAQKATQANGLVAMSDETGIFIYPGFEFKVVDALITNFHLPKSTLMMLVSAFAGMERIRTAYQHAIAQEYRFFSYGDAMMLARV